MPKGEKFVVSIILDVTVYANSVTEAEEIAPDLLISGKADRRRFPIEFHRVEARRSD